LGDHLGADRRLCPVSPLSEWAPWLAVGAGAGGLCVGLAGLWALGRLERSWKGELARERWAARHKLGTLKEVLPARPDEALRLIDYYLADYERSQAAHGDPQKWRR
jgi:hypothetical protein